MPKLLKKISFSILSLYLYLSSTSLVYAQTIPWTDNCKATDPETGIEYAALQGIECIFANILGIIIPLAGLASFITLIIGGFQYLTSAGDPKQAQKANSIITGAIIGLAVTMGVWFIFRLLTDITGINFFLFEIPGP